MEQERTKKEIEQLVVDEYKVYGFDAHTTKVEVRNEGNIIITFNTENPFMGLKFWKFLGTLQKRLQDLGYKRKDKTFYADFYIEEYVK